MQPSGREGGRGKHTQACDESHATDRTSTSSSTFSFCLLLQMNREATGFKTITTRLGQKKEILDLAESSIKHLRHLLDIYISFFYVHVRTFTLLSRAVRDYSIRETAGRNEKLNPENTRVVSAERSHVCTTLCLILYNLTVRLKIASNEY